MDGNGEEWMMTPQEMRNERYGSYVVGNLKKRNFDACYVKTKEEALDEALSRIPKGSLVSWGGSMTLRQIGLLDAVKSGNYRYIDRDSTTNPQERNDLMRQALLCDVFLTSSNAISADGQLINVDGGGNRVAAITFGPKKVLVIAGINKVVPTVEDGIRRIRAVAGPINMMRFVKEDTVTPCSKTGNCGDCDAPGSICNIWNVTRRSMTPNRIQVILVDEELGY